MGHYADTIMLELLWEPYHIFIHFRWKCGVVLHLDTQIGEDETILGFIDLHPECVKLKSKQLSV